jgi:acyl-CoA dehydrogenase
MDDFLTDQFDRLIANLCPASALGDFESGARSFPWETLEASGFLDVLLPADQGGAELSFADCAPLAMILGRRAVPAPVMETMVARALRLKSGDAPSQGPLRLSDLGPTPRHRRLGAVCLAGQMAGAMEAVLDLTITYAKERVQFGRPISAFQAIQQQIAVLAEEAAAAAAATEIAFAHPIEDLTDEHAAIAKIIAGDAAATVSSIAHAVHGAIGVSQEHVLHHFTGSLQRWRLDYGSPSYWADRLGASCLSDDKTPLDFARSVL